ncbi:MAG: hypothetical protein KatS3mg097_003 [Candidatus Parcubacteria bacterium]|nr:MAG: hypothetical protein KatS3mg097_003 [Candidatus Parcubacteria bacterium]
MDNFKFTLQAINIFEELLKAVKNEVTTKEQRVAEFLLLLIYANIKAFIKLCESDFQFKDAVSILHFRPILECWGNCYYIFNSQEKDIRLKLFTNYEIIKLYKLIKKYNLLNEPKWQEIKIKYETLRPFYEELDENPYYNDIKEYVYKKGKKWINKNFQEILKDSGLLLQNSNEVLRGFESIYSITSDLIHGSAYSARYFFGNQQTLLSKCSSYDFGMAYILMDCLNLISIKNIFRINEMLKEKIKNLRQTIITAVEKENRIIT